MTATCRIKYDIAMVGRQYIEYQLPLASLSITSKSGVQPDTGKFLFRQDKYPQRVNKYLFCFGLNRSCETDNAAGSEDRISEIPSPLKHIAPHRKVKVKPSDTIQQIESKQNSLKTIAIDTINRLFVGVSLKPLGLCKLKSVIEQ